MNTFIELVNQFLDANYEQHVAEDEIAWVEEMAEYDNPYLTSEIIQEHRHDMSL